MSPASLAPARSRELAAAGLPAAWLTQVEASALFGRQILNPYAFAS